MGLTRVSGEVIQGTINVGVVTATSFSGNLTGNVNSTGVSTFSTLKVGTGITISAGIVTATTFSGNLTGNVTGNVIRMTNPTGIETYATFNQDAAVELYYDNAKKFETTGTGVTITGDARVTGILTVGTASVTIDGTNNQVNVGTGVTIHHTNGVQVGGNTLHSSGLTVNSSTLAGISSSISDTAVDIFVYDTSKDSDGGAWRKRTTHTSWYNETLNTATRGSRKDFPAVAVIVATDTTITIYDGDDPDMSMWMIFNLGYEAYIGMINGLKSVAMFNGIMSHCGAYDLHVTNFISDKTNRYGDSNGITVNHKLPISGRNDTTAGNYNGPTTPYIANRTGNDVAMTVLPNAPIDAATGLPVPTIAVATNGGVSVIKDDGTVVDTVSSNSGYTLARSVEWSSSNDLLFVMGNGGGSLDYFHTYDGFNTSDNTITIDSKTGSTKNVRSMFRKADVALAYGVHPFDAFTVQGSSVSPDYSKLHVTAKGDAYEYAIRSPQGLTHISENPDSSGSLVSYATTSYATGWLHGDIKGAFLSDTDDTNVTGTELVTNGTFDSNISGWTDNSGSGSSISWSSGTIYLDGSVAYAKADQQITTVAGKTYVMSAEVSGQSGSETSQIWAGTAVNTSDLGSTISSASYNGVMTLTFTATTTTTWIRLYSGWNVYFDNVSVRLAEEDRSVNNKGLQVFGTITKSAVVTGADLVAYSGFSGSNYLEQPHHTGLEVGTGDFYVMGWFKGNDSTYNAPFEISSPNVDTNGVGSILLIVGPAFPGLRFYTRNNSSGDWIHNTNVVPFANDNSTWNFVCCLRRSGVKYIYMNGGAEVNAGTHSDNLTETDSIMRLGYRSDGAGSPWTGSLSLWRFGQGAPSPEQIKKIYEDEKVLFQENAACTLYGSSDAVTALAYDDDNQLLHVGTSSGRSDFQGLRRINNTTTAVTTAMSASNGLVAEQ